MRVWFNIYILNFFFNRKKNSELEAEKLDKKLTLWEHVATQSDPAGSKEPVLNGTESRALSDGAVAEVDQAGDHAVRDRLDHPLQEAAQLGAAKGA